MRDTATITRNITSMQKTVQALATREYFRAWLLSKDPSQIVGCADVTIDNPVTSMVLDLWNLVSNHQYVATEISCNTTEVVIVTDWCSHFWQLDAEMTKVMQVFNAFDNGYRFDEISAADALQVLNEVEGKA